MAAEWSSYGGERRCIHGSGGETWRNKTKRKHSRKRENNIKIDLQDVRSRDMDWIALAPYGSGGGHM